MTLQLIESSDFQAIANSTTQVGAPGIRGTLYIPPARGQINFGADLVNLGLRFDLPSRAPIEIDLSEYLLLEEAQQNLQLREAIYQSGGEFVIFRLIRRKGSVSTVQLELPIYNPGLYGPQVMNLSPFFDGGVLRVSAGSVLEWEIVQTGSGGLLPGDQIEVWGTAVEEAWVPDPELSLLWQSAQALMNANNQLANSITTIVTQQTETLEAILSNQNELILSLRDALQRGTIAPSPQQQPGNTKMRLTYHPSGSVTINQNTVTVPTEPPTPYSTVPATIAGLEPKPGWEVIYEKPHIFDSQDFTGAEYYDATTYKLVLLGGSLKYVPTTREWIRNNDGYREIIRQVWDLASNDWLLYPSY